MLVVCVVANPRNPSGPLVLFSGDVFAPSISKWDCSFTCLPRPAGSPSILMPVSTVTKGKHMVPFLNRIHISCACIGNHDFDSGVILSFISRTPLAPGLMMLVDLNVVCRLTPWRGMSSPPAFPGCSATRTTSELVSGSPTASESTSSPGTGTKLASSVSLKRSGSRH